MKFKDLDPSLKKIYLLGLGVYLLLSGIFFLRSSLLGSEVFLSLLPHHTNRVVSETPLGDFQFSRHSEIANQDITSGTYRENYPPVYFTQLFDYRLVWLMLNREGGLAYSLLNPIYRTFGIYGAKFIWQSFWGGLIYTLIFLLCLKYFGTQTAKYVALLNSVNMSLVFFHYPFLVESMKIGLVLLALLLFSKRVFTAGLLVGLAFSVKVSTLWYLPLFFILVHYYRAYKKLGRFIFACLLGALPFLCLMSIQGWVNENPPDFYFHPLGDLVKSLFSAFYQKSTFLAWLIGDHEIDALGYSSPPLKVFPHSLLFLGLSVFAIYKDKLSRILLSANLAIISLMYISFAISLENLSWNQYLFTPSLLMTVIFARGALFLKDIKIRKFLLAGLMLSNGIFAFQYLKEGGTSRYNDTPIDQVISDLVKDRVRRPYLLSEWDDGRFELLSERKVWPIRLFHFISEKNDFKSEVLRLFNEKKGTWIMSLTDEHTYYQWLELEVKRRGLRTKIYSYRSYGKYIRIDF